MDHTGEDGHGDRSPYSVDYDGQSSLRTPRKSSGRSPYAGKGNFSAGSSGKKNQQVSLNHLLAFTLPARQRNGGGPFGPPFGRRAGQSLNGGGRSSHAQIRFLKERFVNANYRFIVKPTEDYTPYFADPDIFLEWKNILQVIVDTDPSIGARLRQAPSANTHLPQSSSAMEQGTSDLSGKPNCPICLSTPQAARMTKCGHIFCFPCVLHYLQLSENGSKWRQCPICHEAIYAKDLKSVKWYNSKTVQHEHLEISLDNHTDKDLRSPSPQVERKDESTMTFRLVERPQLTTLALPRSPFWPPDSRGNDLSRFTSIHSAPWFFVPDVFLFARFMQATPAYMRIELERDLVELEEEKSILTSLGERQKRARLAETKRLDALRDMTAQAQPDPAALASQRPFANAVYSAIRSSNGRNSPSAISASRPSIPGSSSAKNTDTKDLSAEASNELSIMFVDSATAKVKEQLSKVDSMKTQGVMTGKKIAEHQVRNIQYLQRERERAAILAGTQNIVDPLENRVGIQAFDGAAYTATTTTTENGSSTNATTTSANEVETDRSGDFDDFGSTSVPNSEAPSDWLALRERASGSLGSPLVRPDQTSILPSAARKAKRNVNPPSTDGESLLFYQASTGSHVYLHPLEIKILKAQFGSYKAFPEKLVVKVEHADESTMNDDLRKRCKYLSHLPSGCDVTFVEVDLGMILDKKAIEPYAHAIKQRRQRRLDKSRREEKARKEAMKREQDQVLESIPTTIYSASTSPFAAGGGSATRAPRHPSPLSASWQASLEVATAAELPRFEDGQVPNQTTSPNGIAALSLSSSRQQRTRDQSIEFPRIASTPPQDFSLSPPNGKARGTDVMEKTVWGTRAIKGNHLDDQSFLRDRQSLDDDGDFAVEDGWLRHFEEDVEDRKFDGTASQSKDEAGVGLGLGSGPKSSKKTKKKLVLMSTGGRRTG